MDYILDLPFVESAAWLLLCACLFGFLQSLFPFGTFYMPMDQKLSNLGLTDRDMPASLCGQWLYPFQRPAILPDGIQAEAATKATHVQ
jgi:hypothetical protein